MCVRDNFDGAYVIRISHNDTYSKEPRLIEKAATQLSHAP